jgi:methionine-rich copper-binding protein CopC
MRLRFFVLAISLGMCLASVWAAKPNVAHTKSIKGKPAKMSVHKESTLKPHEIQLIAGKKVYRIFIPEVAVTVDRSWKRDGFTVTQFDRQLQQLEPVACPTSLEITPKAGKNSVVRATKPVAVVFCQSDGWLMRTDDGTHLLHDGTLRLTVKGEWVKVEVYDGSTKLDSLSVKSKKLLFWGCIKMKGRFGRSNRQQPEKKVNHGHI